MPLSYIGGKSRIAPLLIVPNIPLDIETYVEPFSGMMWTFFSMDIDKYPNLKRIVYNDFNPLNVNLFKCLSFPEKLLDECKKIPVQKKGEFPTDPKCHDFFYKSQKELYENKFYLETEPDFNKAAKHALILSSVFSGSNPEKSKYIDLKGKYHSKFTSFMNKLQNPKWIKLFKSITDVENLDFEEVIKKWDNEKTYFYTDPPYYIVGEGSYYSNHSFNREDHLRLSKALKSIKGKFSLSYYDFPQLSEWFPKDKWRWESKEFTKPAMAKMGKVQTKAEEILIMNYERICI